MTKSKLVNYLKTGYPHFKVESKLPLWLLPEPSFTEIADHLGEEKLLALSCPLNLNDDFRESLERLPAPETLPDENWRQTMRSWPSLDRAWSILGTLLEVSGLLSEKFQQRKLQVKPERVCRAIAVLGLAPLVTKGNSLIRDIALTLKSEPGYPAELIRGYAQAVMENDLAMIQQIDKTIAAYPLWREWARLFTAAAQEFPYIPRLIGIAPPLSSELVSVLAEMLQEEEDVKSGRDH